MQHVMVVVLVMVVKVTLACDNQIAHVFQTMWTKQQKCHRNT